MPSSREQPVQKLSDYMKIYVQDGTDNDELEIRFGTRRWNPITQLDFENVIIKLKSLGFKSENTSGSYHLNINNEYLNPATGQNRISRLRTTISQLHNIQAYCKTNTFNFTSPPPHITFVQKIRKEHDGVLLPPIDFDDFHFRVNYKEEKPLRTNFKIVQGLLRDWKDTKKTFRLLKRFTFTHPEYPLKIDCSVVKSSRKVGRNLVTEYRMESSGVLTAPETYEVEIEMIQAQTKRIGEVQALAQLKQTIKIVLSAIQRTNFPISYKEIQSVAAEYMRLIGKRMRGRISSKDFIGPSSISLELPNIALVTEASKTPNIRRPYTVTDKADGIRKLLLITKSRRIYLLDNNLRVQFTGVTTKNTTLSETLLDGEHVKWDKHGKFINNYLAFDIYVKGGKDLRSQAFCPTPGAPKKGPYRLIQLNEMLTAAKFTGMSAQVPPLKIHPKTFYVSNGDTVFRNCKVIIQRAEDGLFLYNIDGLIFTPTDKGVGGDKIGARPAMGKKTWRHSLKWKPPLWNTIDFLVTTKKREDGADFVGNIFQDGDNLRVGSQVTEYKTLILRVGFDERRHGYLNPCRDILEDNFSSKKGAQASYRPVPFYPTDPTPSYPGYLANIALTASATGNHMFTEDGKEQFEDNTIVEFKYDLNAKQLWRWKPIRVRKLKTAELKAGGTNYGNAYHVAQSIWRSIHNPVTEKMITTGKDLPSELADDDIYYNRVAGRSHTTALRNFHNLFVKRLLILATARPGGTLIDMSVGKAGDLSKWIAGKLAFIFGLDISRDNIENRLDGACARYLNYRKRFRSIPYVLFVAADSALPIRTGEACFSGQGKMIAKAIFGSGPKVEQELGPAVYRQYGKGEQGFDIVSNQFSLHYFFKNKVILNGFLRNVSQCCKTQGYFIGTSYDGRRLFRQLSGKATGESLTVTKDGKVLWKIVKQYEADSFEDNISCLGYQVDVYQESINKVFPEYLVNYTYLAKLLENYGFSPVTSAEASELDIPEGVGGFAGLFRLLQKKVQQKQLKQSDIGLALQMTSGEKSISFLNNYFIFKKRRNVNADEVYRVLTEQSQAELEQEQVASDILQKSLEEEKTVAKPVKLNRRVRLAQIPAKKMTPRTPKKIVRVSGSAKKIKLVGTPSKKD